MAKNEKNIKTKVIGGMAWIFGERIMGQMVSMLVTIILARLLAPESYGTISIVLVCINLLDVFVTSSFGSALVQKQEADALDFDTTFVLSFSLSVVLYILLFFVAPLIAAFYEIPELTPILRVMGLRLPLASINNTQNAYIQRRMNFKRSFLAHVFSTIGSGIAGIVMAYCGFGVWALVTQNLTNMLAVTVMLTVMSEWKPKLRFAFQRAKTIWNFGSKVLLTQMVVTLNDDVRSLIVGKVFGTADLAYYDQGKKYPSFIMVNISSTIDRVMLPAYSQVQEDRERILAMLRRSIRVGIFVLAPVLLGFCMVSESFVKVLLTEKWMACVPFMQVFCLSYLTRPLESSSRQALLAIGKSGAVLWAIVAINVTALLGVLVSVFVFESVFAIALSSLLTTMVSLVCFLSLSNKFFGYTLKMQLQDSMPTILVGLIMCLVVGLMGLLPIPAIVTLVLQVLVGMAVYVACSAVLKLEPFTYLLGMLKDMRKNKK